VEALQEEFNFTAEDYAANQRGQYSNAQHAVIAPLVTRMNNDPSCFIVLAGGLGVSVLGLILLNIALGGVIVAFLSIYPYGVIAALAALGFVVTLIISAFSVTHMRRSMSSMNRFVIRATEGPATVQRSWSDVVSEPTTPLIQPQHLTSLRNLRSYHGIHYYRVDIGKKAFYMLQPSAEHFLPGAVYRVYYLHFPYGGVCLLSAELIRMP
jgi:hypothetical protein